MTRQSQAGRFATHQPSQKAAMGCRSFRHFTMSRPGSCSINVLRPIRRASSSKCGCSLTAGGVQAHSHTHTPTPWTGLERSPGMFQRRHDGRAREGGEGGEKGPSEKPLKKRSTRWADSNGPAWGSTHWRGKMPHIYEPLHRSDRSKILLSTGRAPLSRFWTLLHPLRVTRPMIHGPTQ